MARLVLNHSTFIPGLLPILQKLSTSTAIRTIVPGRIYKVSSKRVGPMQLKITTRAPVGSSSFAAHDTESSSEKQLEMQKVLARNKSMAQEIFLISHMGLLNSSLEVQEHLQSVLAKEACTVDIQGDKSSQIKNAKGQTSHWI